MYSGINTGRKVEASQPFSNLSPGPETPPPIDLHLEFHKASIGRSRRVQPATFSQTATGATFDPSPSGVVQKGPTLCLVMVDLPKPEKLFPTRFCSPQYHVTGLCGRGGGGGLCRVASYFFSVGRGWASQVWGGEEGCCQTMDLCPTVPPPKRPVPPSKPYLRTCRWLWGLRARRRGHTAPGTRRGVSLSPSHG